MPRPMPLDAPVTMATRFLFVFAFITFFPFFVRLLDVGYGIGNPNINHD